VEVVPGAAADLEVEAAAAAAGAGARISPISLGIVQERRFGTGFPVPNFLAPKKVRYLAPSSAFRTEFARLCLSRGFKRRARIFSSFALSCEILSV